MTSSETTIVWFRRDLRLADQPALHAAAELGRVVPVYVHAPDEEGEWPPGPASNWWLHHSLTRLDAALQRLGLCLNLRTGPTHETLADVARECGATRLHWNRLYEPAIVARDRVVQQSLEAQGLVCESFNGALLFEPWAVRTAQDAPYRVFTPFWRAAQARLDEQPLPVAAPRRLQSSSRRLESIALEALRLLPRIGWDAEFAKHWTPGEDGAHRRLDDFCRTSLARYAQGRERPDDLDGSSHLSPHLHFGEVTPRQCLAAVRNVVAAASATARESAATFLRELGWREFAHHLLQAYPHTVDRPLDERFERFPWVRNDDWLRAWQRGRTGIPLVDAGMRELWTTGWMHNRVRMVVASLLTKNLRQNWADGARWFWDTLVDADLANNTLGWQWTAGCGADAAPFFRIFNPALQAERCDPRRVYLRRWLPELANLPDTWIHRPWEAPVAVLEQAGVVLGETYPMPIVDLAESRREALAAYKKVGGG
jgi:deoxyribodipyrimidine photo-lyase